jgi:hypothetical protein
MFHELKRGVLARAIGQATIPLKFTTYAGLAMPVFTASCIVEMVVPYESVKIGCRITKQVIGFPFLICCLTIDKVTQPFEKISFGQPIPIDANNLMGTMPTRSDIGMLDEIMGLKEQAQYPGNLGSITEATRKRCGELFPNLGPDDMLSSVASTVDDFAQVMGSNATGNNMSPIQAPIYNSGTMFGPYQYSNSTY